MRAFWERVNRFGVTDRIEIHDSQSSDDPIRLQSDSTGFSFRHDEVSQGGNNLVNIHEIQIQTGRLDFWPKIQSQAEKDLLSDILGAPAKRFQVHWKRDGNVYWKGYPDPGITSFPETGAMYFGQIRAADFEVLKGIDLPFTITRDSIIKNLAFLLDFLEFDLPIQTSTSWTTLTTTDSTDFLSQIYCNREALRQFARRGGEVDRRTTVYEALAQMCDPLLLVKQINGKFLVEQLTAFSDPQNVYQTTYDSGGNVTTATAPVDRRQAGYTSASQGSPSVKITSSNDSYPGLKQVKVRFEHRASIQGIKFPPEIVLTGTDIHSEEMFFISTGEQWLRLRGSVRARMREFSTHSRITLQIRVLRDGQPDYYWDGSSWQTGNGSFEIDLDDMGGDVWRADIDVNPGPLSGKLPADADGTLIVTLYYATGSTEPALAFDTTYTDMSLQIQNPSVEEGNNFSIDFQVTQEQDFPTIFTYRDTWYGDGPTSYALSAYTTDASGMTLTAETWGRRGTAGWRNFHYNLLKDLLDSQRSRTRKISAELHGEYDPEKVLVYNGENFYYAGGRYDGRWHPVLMRINIQGDG